MSRPVSSVIVSGGSRGLGLAIVRHLLDRGISVATFARQETEAVAELSRDVRDRFLFRTLDARDEGRSAAFVSTCFDQFPEPIGLVNNAAIGQDNLLAHLSPEKIRELVDINTVAPMLLTREMVRQIIGRGQTGRIVTISSICGSRGYAGLTVYSATKGALNAFTRSLARELGGRHILVNALAPGFFESEMSVVLSADQIETIRRRTPTGRLIAASDTLPALDFFLFGETNVTGHVLTVDGGLTC